METNSLSFCVWFRFRFRFRLRFSNCFRYCFQVSLCKNIVWANVGQSKGPLGAPGGVCLCLCLCLCLQVCFLAHAFVNHNIKNEKLNCFFSWSFSKNVCAFFKVIHCPGVLGVGFPTQSTRRPVGRRGPHTMLPGRRPAPPPQRPSHTTHYNIILYNTNGE